VGVIRTDTLRVKHCLVSTILLESGEKRSALICKTREKNSVHCCRQSAQCRFNRKNSYSTKFLAWTSFFHTLRWDFNCVFLNVYFISVLLLDSIGEKRRQWRILQASGGGNSWERHQRYQRSWRLLPVQGKERVVVLSKQLYIWNWPVWPYGRVFDVKYHVLYLALWYRVPVHAT
jgi:hypothetical protein